MSHTPGPWEFDGEDYIFAKPIGEGRMIAQVRGWGWLQYKGEDAAVAEQRANGLLLAAAPLLLEACKAALNDAKAGYERHGLSAETTTLLQDARAAAEGPEEEEKQWAQPGVKA